MKTSLWIVIALVSGIVGFLTGYSVSSFSAPGARRPPAHAAATAHAGEATPPAGYGAPAPAPAPAPAGYGAEAAPPPEARKADKPAAAPAASPQTAAAGY